MEYFFKRRFFILKKEKKKEYGLDFYPYKLKLFHPLECLITFTKCE